MNSKLSLIIVAIAALVTISCGKANRPQAKSVDKDTLGIMTSSMQLSVPDGSYGPKPSPFAITAQGNVDSLMDTINSIGASLKESNSRFEQVKNEGARSNGGMTITHAALNAQLVGTKDDKNGLITWTYTRNGTTYFSGTTRIFGETGELSFPANGFSPKPLTLRWEFKAIDGNLSKIVTARQDAANYLEFTIDIATNAITMTGLVNGTISVGGRWDSVNGGSYTEGAALKRCWNARLENVDCLN